MCVILLYSHGSTSDLIMTEILNWKNRTIDCSISVWCIMPFFWTLIAAFQKLHVLLHFSRSTWKAVQSGGQAPQGRHCKQEASHSPMDCRPPLQALFEVTLILHPSDSFPAKESKDFNNWKCKPERKKEKKLLDKDLVVKKGTGLVGSPTVRTPLSMVVNDLEHILKTGKKGKQELSTFIVLGSRHLSTVSMVYF